MSFQTAGDIPIQVASETAGSERRISPSWTIGQLKSKLELITGIPPLSQKLSLNRTGQPSIPIEAVDEDSTQLANFPLAPQAEIYVTDTRPPGQRPNYTDVSKTEKYEMPLEEYEKRSGSVLAWKKASQLGRFDPDAPSHEQAKIQAFESEIQNKGIKVGQRCRVGGEDNKRGEVMFVGEVDEIPNAAGKWIGIKLDEPIGKNDGTINGKVYWGPTAGGAKYGVFVRPERVEVGNYPEIDDLADLEEF